jgi:hypothetical protein
MDQGLCRNHVVSEQSRRRKSEEHKPTERKKLDGMLKKEAMRKAQRRTLVGIRRRVREPDKHPRNEPVS